MPVDPGTGTRRPPPSRKPRKKARVVPTKTTPQAIQFGADVGLFTPERLVPKKPPPAVRGEAPEEKVPRLIPQKSKRKQPTVAQQQAATARAETARTWAALKAPVSVPARVRVRETETAAERKTRQAVARPKPPPQSLLRRLAGAPTLASAGERVARGVGRAAADVGRYAAGLPERAVSSTLEQAYKPARPVGSGMATGRTGSDLLDAVIEIGGGEAAFGADVGAELEQGAASFEAKATEPAKNIIGPIVEGFRKGLGAMQAALVPSVQVGGKGQIGTADISSASAFSPEVAKNLTEGLAQAVAGAPAGAYLLATDPGKVWEDTKKLYPDYYGPLLEGDFEQFQKNIAEQPAQILFDLWAVLSLGYGAATRAAAIGATIRATPAQLGNVSRGIRLVQAAMFRKEPYESPVGPVFGRKPAQASQYYRNAAGDLVRIQRIAPQSAIGEKLASMTAGIVTGTGGKTAARRGRKLLREEHEQRGARSRAELMVYAEQIRDYLPSTVDMAARVLKAAGLANVTGTGRKGRTARTVEAGRYDASRALATAFDATARHGGSLDNVIAKLETEIAQRQGRVVEGAGPLQYRRIDDLGRAVTLLSHYRSNPGSKDALRFGVDVAASREIANEVEQTLVQAGILNADTAQRMLDRQTRDVEIIESVSSARRDQFEQVLYQTWGDQPDVHKRVHAALTLLDAQALSYARRTGNDPDLMYDEITEVVLGEPPEGALEQIGGFRYGPEPDEAAKNLVSKERTRGWGRGFQVNKPRKRGGLVIIGTVTPVEWVKRVLAMIPDRAMRDYYARWYEHFEPLFREVFGADAPKVMRAFAVSQANDSPTGGLKAVLSVLSKHLNGEEIEPRQISLVVEGIDQALKGLRIDKGMAAKLTDFADALMGRSVRTWMGRKAEGGEPIPVDIWAGRDLGYVDGKMVERLKELYGLVEGTHYELDTKGGKMVDARYERAAEQYAEIAAHLNMTRFDGRDDWRGDQVQALGWATAQLILGKEPETLQMALDANARRVSFELTAGPEGLGEGLTREQIQVAARQMESALRALIAATPGIYFRGLEHDLGGWEGGVTPAIHVLVIGSRRAVQDLVTRIAYATRQHLVQASREGGKKARAALVIDSPAFADPDLKARFFERLYELDPSLEGFMPDDVDGVPAITIRTGGEKVTKAKAASWLRQYAATIETVETELGIDVGYNVKNIELLIGDQYGEVGRLATEGRNRWADAGAVDDPLARAVGTRLEAVIAAAAGERELPRPGELRGGKRLLAAQLRASLGRALQGLPGAITVPGLGRLRFGPIREAQELADSYMQEAGLAYSPPRTYALVDPVRATRIADAYEAMPHAPDEPQVKAAYQAMITETLAQYRTITEAGYEFEFYPEGPDPYPSPRHAMLDLLENRHLFVYPTDEGFGTLNAIADNPLLGDSGLRWNGRVVTHNDLFRGVHDFFGHYKEGVGFRADGEENAWRSHSAMYSPLARLAMTTETRGQNSWVNYGPHGESNRTAQTADTVFADQKVGILPAWVSEEGSGDPPEIAGMEAFHSDVQVLAQREVGPDDPLEAEAAELEAFLKPFVDNFVRYLRESGQDLRANRDQRPRRVQRPGSRYGIGEGDYVDPNDMPLIRERSGEQARAQTRTKAEQMLYDSAKDAHDPRLQKIVQAFDRLDEITAEQTARADAIVAQWDFARHYEVDERPPRAGALVHPDGTVIVLSENADLTSVVHEAAHAFIPEQLRWLNEYDPEWAERVGGRLELGEDGRPSDFGQEVYAYAVESWAAMGSPTVTQMREAFGTFRGESRKVYGGRVKMPTEEEMPGLRAAVADALGDRDFVSFIVEMFDPLWGMKAGDGSFFIARRPPLSRNPFGQLRQRRGLGKSRERVHQRSGVLEEQARDVLGPVNVLENAERWQRHFEQQEKLQELRASGLALEVPHEDGLYDFEQVPDDHVIFNPDGLRGWTRNLSEAEARAFETLNSASPSLEDAALDLSPLELQQLIHDTSLTIANTVFPKWGPHRETSEGRLYMIPAWVKDAYIRDLSGQLLQRNVLEIGLTVITDVAKTLNALQRIRMYTALRYVVLNIGATTALNTMHQGIFFPWNLGRAVRLAHANPGLMHRLSAEVGTGFYEALDAGALSRGAPTVAQALENVAQWLGTKVSKPEAFLRSTSMIHHLHRAGIDTDAQVTRLLDKAKSDQDAREFLNQIARYAEEDVVRFRGMPPVERDLLRMIFFVSGWLVAATRFTLRYPVNHPMWTTFLAQLGDDGWNEMRRRMEEFVQQTRYSMQVKRGKTKEGVEYTAQTDLGQWLPFGTAFDIGGSILSLPGISDVLGVDPEGERRLVENLGLGGKLILSLFTHETVYGQPYTYASFIDDFLVTNTPVDYVADYFPGAFKHLNHERTPSSLRVDQSTREYTMEWIFGRAYPSKYNRDKVVEKWQQTVAGTGQVAQRRAKKWVDKVEAFYGQPPDENSVRAKTIMYDWQSTWSREEDEAESELDKVKLEASIKADLMRKYELIPADHKYTADTYEELLAVVDTDWENTVELQNSLANDTWSVPDLEELVKP